MSKLYFIEDRISKVAETSIIECENDAVALRAFKDFCSKDSISPVEHELICICELNTRKYVCDIDLPHYPYVVATGDKVEEVYNEMVQNIIASEDENGN